MKLKEIADKYESHNAFLEAVATKVLELADAQPDFKYSPERGYRCRYNARAERVAESTKTIVYGPECNGCILGQAMQLLGWKDEEELQSVGTFNNLVYNKAGVPLSELRIELNFVQSQQDDGNTWRTAVTQLREHMSSLSANAPATELN